MEKASIIIPNYNQEKYIGDCLNSVVSQTYSNWEVLVIDDCSTDGSRAIISDFSKRDERIKPIFLENNGGSAAARNAGLEKATGRYIVFLDSDDFWDCKFLETQILFLIENGPIVTGNYHRLAPNSNTEFVVRKKIDYKGLLEGCDLSCLTTVYDKTIIGERFFDVTLKRGEDLNFWLEILKDVPYVYGNQNSLATYRILKKSKSRNKIKVARYMWEVYHKRQKLSFFRSVRCMIQWVIYGLKKYRNVK